MLLVALSASSCLNEYLDKSPDSDLDEEAVFTKYKNFKSYFTAVYTGSDTKMRPYYPLCFNLGSGKISTDCLTDICDPARDNPAHQIKLGDGSQAITQFGYNTKDGVESGKLVYAWKILRICNKTIENIDMLQDATESEKEDMLAQAYFIRAYVHFDIFRFYGAVPYVDKVLDIDDCDLPAIDENEFLLKVADDFQTAADHFKTAGKMRRDPDKKLNASDMSRPSGVAALALKGRALMYAASPLNNPDNDITRWEKAAEANWEALQVALENGYQLLAFSKISTNFHDTYHTNEQLWGYGYTNIKLSNQILQAIVPGIFAQGNYAAQNVGRCPTQNFVDKFETIDGYALNTEEDRKKATDAGSYYEQNPYVNRDPRLDLSVVYNQKKVSGFTEPASMYIDEDGNKGEWMKPYSEARDNSSRTYYFECKTVGGPYKDGNQKYVKLADPIIRLAEVYLNYAECAAEAYGGSAGKAPEADMTSVEALNVVRTRAGMPDVRSEYLTDMETYRSRVKNERNIELCFEGDHYYCDIRRWKDAPAIGRSKLYGMRATKLNPGYDAELYPTGFRYERFELPANRQIVWKNDGMYYIRFKKADLRKMKNYTPKQEW